LEVAQGFMWAGTWEKVPSCFEGTYTSEWDDNAEEGIVGAKGMGDLLSSLPTVLVMTERY